MLFRLKKLTLGQGIGPDGFLARNIGETKAVANTDKAVAGPRTVKGKGTKAVAQVSVGVKKNRKGVLAISKGMLAISKGVAETIKGVGENSKGVEIPAKGVGENSKGVEIPAKGVEGKTMPLANSTTVFRIPIMVLVLQNKVTSFGLKM